METSRLDDVLKPGLEAYKVFFGDEEVTLNKNGVIKIKYHTPCGEGDAHFVDIYTDNGSIARCFNPSSIEFRNQEAIKHCEEVANTEEKGMTKEEIQEYVKNCPYSDKSIDSIHTCDLEFHYRKICPSPKCACATKFYGENSSHDQKRNRRELK